VWAGGGGGGGMCVLRSRYLQSERARCILVGDPRQLPATVMSQAGESLRYGRSLFERLQTCHLAVTMLDVQYRMHPLIRAFPSQHFYEGRLQDSRCVRARAPKPYLSRAGLGPCVFWDVAGQEMRRHMSMCNKIEARVVVALLQALFDGGSGTTAAGNAQFTGKVGVLTPYRAQLSELRRQYLLHSMSLHTPAQPFFALDWDLPYVGFGCTARVDWQTECTE
jgi:senataxin